MWICKIVKEINFCKGWSPKFATRLNIIIGIVQSKSIKSDQAVLLPKWFPLEYTILAKEQSSHSYTFWSMPIITFSSVANFSDHPLPGSYFIPSQIGGWSDTCMTKIPTNTAADFENDWVNQ